MWGETKNKGEISVQQIKGHNVQKNVLHVDGFSARKVEGRQERREGIVTAPHVKITLYSTYCLTDPYVNDSTVNSPPSISNPSRPVFLFFFSLFHASDPRESKSIFGINIIFHFLHQIHILHFPHLVHIRR